MSYDAPPPPQSPYGESPYGAPAASTNTKAIVSLVLGIVSIPFTCLCGFGGILGIVAIVLGLQSKSAPTGRGMAIGGIATGAASLALLLLVVILYATGVTSAPRGT